MPPSTAMWRLLPPWQNLSNGAIVSIWPCMPDFHRCSLGLHSPTWKLVKQLVSANEVVECPHYHSGQLWLTALPLAIIFSILLVSIAAQDYTVIDATSNAQIQLPVEQRVHIYLPFRASVSSLWNVLTDNLGRFFSVRRFDPKPYRSNQSSSTRSVRIPSRESSSDEKLETDFGLQGHVQSSVHQPTETSSKLNPGLLSDLIPQSNQGMPRLLGLRQHKNQEDLNRKRSSVSQHLTELEVPTFRKLASLPNNTCSNTSQCSSAKCGQESEGDLCSERFVHIAMTLDVNYLRGSMAAIYSILLHAECSSNIQFHFVATKGKEELEKVLAETLPFLQFLTYTFDESSVKSRISHAVRHALEEPLNYARFYLAHMIDPCVKRIIYLDSDVLVLDRIEELWRTNMGNSTMGTPKYCHANFPSNSISQKISGQILHLHQPLQISSLATSTQGWVSCKSNLLHPQHISTLFFSGFLISILVLLDEHTSIMRPLSTYFCIFLFGRNALLRVQKEQHIYELGSLPPLLLTFAGDIQAIDSRWNQHGLGGDILKGDCRPTRNEPASLLHWSGGGKPWQRLDVHQPCPVDSIWAQYDLLEPINL